MSGATLDKQRVIDTLKQCRTDMAGTSDDLRYLYNAGRNSMVDYMLVQIMLGDLDATTMEGQQQGNKGIRQSSETDSPLPPSTMPKRGESLCPALVGIHCPLCGYHQIVLAEEWFFQHTQGHGHTCGSGRCPSHTFMVLDDFRSHQHLFDFSKSSEPSYITIKDGSDKDYRPVSMHEIQELMYAINEECVGKKDTCPPGHLKEMHDLGNEILDRIRKRPSLSQ